MTSGAPDFRDEVTVDVAPTARDVTAPCDLTRGRERKRGRSSWVSNDRGPGRGAAPAEDAGETADVTARDRECHANVVDKAVTRLGGLSPVLQKFHSR